MQILNNTSVNNNSYMNITVKKDLFDSTCLSCYIVTNLQTQSNVV